MASLTSKNMNKLQELLMVRVDPHSYTEVYWQVPKTTVEEKQQVAERKYFYIIVWTHNIQKEH